MQGVSSDRMLLDMPGLSSRVITWSAALCAAAGVLAGFSQHVRWLFITAVVIAPASLVILLAAGITDLIAWIREFMERRTGRDLKLIVKRRFSVDWDRGGVQFNGLELIVYNDSSTDVRVTKITIRPNNFAGPAKYIGNIKEEVLNPGSVLTRKIRRIDFIDILGLSSIGDIAGDAVFTVRVESGYGSKRKARDSKPFTLKANSLQPIADGFDEWTELA